MCHNTVINTNTTGYLAGCFRSDSRARGEHADGRFLPLLAFCELHSPQIIAEMSPGVLFNSTWMPESLGLKGSSRKGMKYHIRGCE